MQLQRLLEQLLDVSIALSAERDLNNLLDLILREARRVMNADAGTLYLVTRDNRLEFKLSQVQTLFDRWGEEATRKRFNEFTLEINDKSMAGHVALTGEILNIPNVQHLPPTSRFHYDPSFDKKNDYNTVSMLVVPIKNRDNETIGVLQIINALDHEKHIIPFNETAAKIAQSLASQAGVAIQNAYLNSNLKDAQFETILKLSTAAEYRDNETANHIKRMSRYSLLIARTIGWDKEAQENLLIAAPMHDIGKLGTPDSILLKPGRHTPEERAVMQQHSVIGGIILTGSSSPLLYLSKTIALTHHERYDGEGYPMKLKGRDIPLEGRITAIADVFDALSSKRVYKEAWPEEKVLDYLQSERGKHFDGELVDAFITNMEEIRVIQKMFNDTDEDFDKYKDIPSVDPFAVLQEGLRTEAGASILKQFFY